MIRHTDAGSVASETASLALGGGVLVYTPIHKSRLFEMPRPCTTGDFFDRTFALYPWHRTQRRVLW